MALMLSDCSDRAGSVLVRSLPRNRYVLPVNGGHAEPNYGAKCRVSASMPTCHVFRASSGLHFRSMSLEAGGPACGAHATSDRPRAADWRGSILAWCLAWCLAWNELTIGPPTGGYDERRAGERADLQARALNAMLA